MSGTAPEPTTKLNFPEDWRGLLAQALQADGYAVRPTDSADDVAIKFFNVRRGLVEARKRRVIESDTFSCPADVAAGYAALKVKFEAGDDVTPHQSRNWHERAEFFDGMLHDWGIQHFHLGEQLEPSGSGLMVRTGPILYALVAADTVYCIKIDEHGKWAELDLLRSVFRNWPELLERHRSRGFNGFSGTAITESDLLLRRKHGIVGLIEIEPGVVLFSPGGGYASSRASIPVVKTVQLYRRILRDLEDHVRSNEDVIRQDLSDAGFTPETPLTLVLRVRNEEFVAVHEPSKRIYGLGVALGL